MGDLDLTPLVYKPGSLGAAANFKGEMVRLAPRTTVAIDARGIGASSAPRHGYALGDRVRDLQAVLDELQLAPACFMAFSAGVPVALSYVISHPDHVKGSILLDYPAVSRALADGWAEQARPFAQNRGIPEHVIGSMIQESQTVELWDDAASISTPVLLIKGGRSNAITEEALSRYRQALPHLQLEIFDDSGHEVFQPDYERFMQTIERFLRRID